MKTCVIFEYGGDKYITGGISSITCKFAEIYDPKNSDIKDRVIEISNVSSVSDLPHLKEDTVTVTALDRSNNMFYVAGDFDLDGKTYHIDTHEDPTEAIENAVIEDAPIIDETSQEEENTEVGEEITEALTEEESSNSEEAPTEESTPVKEEEDKSPTYEEIENAVVNENYNTTEDLVEEQEIRHRYDEPLPAIVFGKNKSSINPSKRSPKTKSTVYGKKRNTGFTFKGQHSTFQVPSMLTKSIATPSDDYEDEEEIEDGIEIEDDEITTAEVPVNPKNNNVTKSRRRHKKRRDEVAETHKPEPIHVIIDKDNSEEPEEKENEDSDILEITPDEIPVDETTGNEFSFKATSSDFVPKTVVNEEDTTSGTELVPAYELFVKELSDEDREMLESIPAELFKSIMQYTREPIDLEVLERDGADYCTANNWHCFDTWFCIDCLADDDNSRYFYNSTTNKATSITYNTRMMWRRYIKQ